MANREDRVTFLPGDLVLCVANHMNNDQYEFIHAFVSCSSFPIVMRAMDIGACGGCFHYSP
jgi:hypothetical protein